MASIISGPLALSGTALTDDLSSLYSGVFSKQTGFTPAMFIGETGAGVIVSDPSEYGCYVHSASPSSANYSVFIDITRPNNNTSTPTCGVVIRAQSGATQLIAMLMDIPNNRVGLFRWDSAVSTTQLGSWVSHTLSLTDTERFELRASTGNVFTVHIDGGAAVITETDATYTAAGKGGLLGYSMRQPSTSDSARMLNFDITETSGGTSYSITAAQGSFTLTGQSANLSAARPITAAQGSFALTGQNAGFTSSRSLIAAQGAFALTGQDVTLTYAAAGNYSIAAGQGSYGLTGSDSYADYAMSAAGGSYTLTGQDVTLTYVDGGVATSLIADMGLYTLTGRNARLHWSGEPIAPNRQAGIYMGMRIGL